MPRANIRYEDVLAEHKAREMEEYDRQTRREWSWFASVLGGFFLLILGVIWWLS